MNRSTLRRSLPALALIVVGIWLTSGCIYIPTFNATVTGKNAANSVGQAGSKKPITPGTSTRDQVLKVLGKPFYQTSDGHYLVYSWERRKGILIWPLCFHGAPEDISYAMTLEFAPEGLLTAFNIEEGEERSSGYIDPPDADRFVPARVLTYQGQLEIENRSKFGVPVPPVAPANPSASPRPPPGTPYRTAPGP